LKSFTNVVCESAELDVGAKCGECVDCGEPWA